MRPVHAFASHRHYASHIAPVWLALAPEERGQFFTGSREALIRARHLGLNPVPRVVHRLPPSQRTRIDGHQPAVIVAAFGDLAALGQRRAVLIEHGAGQNYGAGPEGGAARWFAGGANRERVDVFLCPNAEVAERNRATYPKAYAAVVGSPHMEHLRAIAAADAGAGRRPDGVGFTFHWPCPLIPEAGSGWTWLAGAVEELALDPARRWPIVGHGHPRYWSTLGPWWTELSAKAAKAGCAPVRVAAEFDDVAAHASTLVVDNSSALFEWCALDRPVVVLNPPEYRRHVEHGLRFWTWADVGPQIDDPAQLPFAIDAAPNWPGDRRRAAALEIWTPSNKATAAQRSVAALRAALP